MWWYVWITIRFYYTVQALGISTQKTWSTLSALSADGFIYSEWLHIYSLLWSSDNVYACIVTLFTLENIRENNWSKKQKELQEQLLFCYVYQYTVFHMYIIIIYIPVWKYIKCLMKVVTLLPTSSRSPHTSWRRSIKLNVHTTPYDVLGSRVLASNRFDARFY